MIIGIIGAGASGMVAAITASMQEDVEVLLFEKQQRVGKKLHATGNGRCNLSNINMGMEHYHGDEPDFAKFALENMNVEDTLKWFKGLGLFTMVDKFGKVYPYSEQANSVVDVLRLALNKPNIKLYTEFEVKKIKKNGQGFSVESAEEKILCDKVIVCAGGLAGSKIGGSLSGYKLLSALGHKATPLRPTLVQIKSDWRMVASLKGVRTNCSVEIFHNGNLFASSKGELQFTEYGVSGPVIFEISRDVCREKGDWTCKIDFLPEYTKEEIESELLRRKETELSMEDLLTGIIHNKLGRVLTKMAGIKGKMLAKEISDTEIKAVARAIKELEIDLTEPMGMDNAQVTAGGVKTCNFDPSTMESKLVPGLYACGEVLDVDGDCGGYNLQWAWSSGYLAGLNAGKSN